MFRVIVLAVAALTALTAACSSEGEMPQAVAVAVTAPGDKADQEVLVASQPSGAKIILKGAEVGETPMKLLVRGDTNVVLEKEGYVKQALLITPKSDPNLVVKLVATVEEDSAAEEGTEDQEPDVAEEAEVAQETAEASASSKGSGKKKKSKVKAAEAVEEEAEPEPVAEPAEEKASTPDPKPSAKKAYTTMAQIKKAYREGKITKAQYRQYQAEIRRKRAVELEAAEAAYREGKMTKTQYKEKVRAIKVKYEG